MTPSSSSKLSLSNVSLITSGYFMCMVTGGDIPFKEDYDTKHVTVAGEENNEKDILLLKDDPQYPQSPDPA